MGIEINRGSGWTAGFASIDCIETSIASGNITNTGVLAELFDTVLRLVDAGYIAPEETEELFADAMSRRFPLER